MNNPGLSPRSLRTNEPLKPFIVWDDLGRQPEGWLYPVYANSV